MEKGCWVRVLGNFLGGRLPGAGLCAEESPRGVDVEGTFPLFGRHVDGVSAADDAGETAEDVCAAQLCGCLLDGLLHLGRVRNIDFFRYNQDVWKVRPQGFNFCICV